MQNLTEPIAGSIWLRLSPKTDNSLKVSNFEQTTAIKLFDILAIQPDRVKDVR